MGSGRTLFTIPLAYQGLGVPAQLAPFLVPGPERVPGPLVVVLVRGRSHHGHVAGGQVRVAGAGVLDLLRVWVDRPGQLDRAGRRPGPRGTGSSADQGRGDAGGR